MATRIEYGTDTDIELQEPKKYKVILLNDNYSTVEFVIQVLMQIFKKNLEEATTITMNIHEQGKVSVEFIPMRLPKQKWHKYEQMQEKRSFHSKLYWKRNNKCQI